MHPCGKHCTLLLTRHDPKYSNSVKTVHEEGVKFLRKWADRALLLLAA